MFGLEEGTVIISAFIWSGCSCWKCWCFRNLAELESTVYFVIPTPQLPIDFRAFFGVYHYSYNPIHNDRRGPPCTPGNIWTNPKQKWSFGCFRWLMSPDFQLTKCEEFRWSSRSGFQGCMLCQAFTPSFGEYIPHEFFGMGFIRISSMETSLQLKRLDPDPCLLPLGSRMGPGRKKHHI